MDWSKVYCRYRSDLRESKTEIDLLRLLCKILIEIWWNTVR